MRKEDSSDFTGDGQAEFVPPDIDSDELNNLPAQSVDDCSLVLHISEHLQICAKTNLPKEAARKKYNTGHFCQRLVTLVENPKSSINAVLEIYQKIKTIITLPCEILIKCRGLSRICLTVRLLDCTWAKEVYVPRHVSKILLRSCDYRARG